MFDDNQIVKVKWGSANKKWYESKGYNFTALNDYFDVFARDLTYGTKAKINANCDYCGKEYTTYYTVLVKGRKIHPKDACPHCASQKASEVSKNKRAYKYIGLARQICEEKGYILLTTEEDYTDIKMLVAFICPKHGKQTIRLEVLLRGSGCLACAIEFRAKKLALNSSEVKEYVESINNNTLLNPDDYINNHTINLKILCSCGNVFVTSFASYKDGVNKCSCCSHKESRGEERIRLFLDDNKISYEQEKRFEDCRNVKPLPFDFYLPQYNLIIEFDGKHHFEETGRGNHETTVKHDEIKNKYCEDHDINILRIPYWDGNDIEKIISKQLNL